MMTEKQEALYRFFSDKANHLQNEIDLEIEKIGGEKMLISREDLIHWVYYARGQVETYKTICRMLEDQAEGVDTDQILLGLREKVERDETAIDLIRKRREEQEKALACLREEAEYYRLALEVLGS